MDITFFYLVAKGKQPHSFSGFATCLLQKIISTASILNRNLQLIHFFFSTRDCQQPSISVIGLRFAVSDRMAKFQHASQTNHRLANLRNVTWTRTNSCDMPRWQLCDSWKSLSCIPYHVLYVLPSNVYAYSRVPRAMTELRLAFVPVKRAHTHTHTPLLAASCLDVGPCMCVCVCVPFLCFGLQ